MSKEQVHDIKRKAKTHAIAWTIIYTLFFPFAVYYALFSTMVFDSSQMPVLKGLSIIFISSLIPISLPLTIDLMWSSYLCEEYNKVLGFVSMPWLVFIGVVFLTSILQFS
jgi:hypothetical protein